MRLMVAVRELTGAGSLGLTIEPSGSFSVIGRKQPPLVVMLGSVMARRAKQLAARLPEGTTLKGPRTCGEEPAKSTVMAPSPTVTATSMRMRRSRSMPSLSRKSTAR